MTENLKLFFPEYFSHYYNSSISNEDNSKNYSNSRGGKRKRKPSLKEKYEFMKSVGFPDDVIDAFKTIHNMKYGWPQQTIISEDKSISNTKETNASILVDYVNSNIVKNMLDDIMESTVKKLGTILANKFYMAIELEEKEKEKKKEALRREEILINENAIQVMDVVSVLLLNESIMANIERIQMKYEAKSDQVENASYENIASNISKEVYLSSVKLFGNRLSDKFVKSLINIIGSNILKEGVDRLYTTSLSDTEQCKLKDQKEIQDKTADKLSQEGTLNEKSAEHSQLKDSKNEENLKESEIKNEKDLSFINDALLTMENSITNNLENLIKSSKAEDFDLVKKSLDDLSLINKENIETLRLQSNILEKILDKVNSPDSKTDPDKSLHVDAIKKELENILNYNKSMESQLNKRLDSLTMKIENSKYSTTDTSAKLNDDNPVENISQDKTLQNVNEISLRDGQKSSLKDTPVPEDILSKTVEEERLRLQIEEREFAAVDLTDEIVEEKIKVIIGDQLLEEQRSQVDVLNEDKNATESKNLDDKSVKEVSSKEKQKEKLAEDSEGKDDKDLQSKAHGDKESSVQLQNKDSSKKTESFPANKSESDQIINVSDKDQISTNQSRKEIENIENTSVIEDMFSKTPKDKSMDEMREESEEKQESRNDKNSKSGSEENKMKEINKSLELKHKHDIHDKWIQNYPHLIHLMLALENSCISSQQETRKFMKEDKDKTFHSQLINIFEKCGEMSKILVQFLGTDEDPTNLIDPITNFIKALSAEWNQKLMEAAPKIPIKIVIDKAEALIKKLKLLSKEDVLAGSSKTMDLVPSPTINFTKCSTSFQLDNELDMPTEVNIRCLNNTSTYVIDKTCEDVIQSLIEHADKEAQLASNKILKLKILNSLMDLDECIGQVTDDIIDAMNSDGDIFENLQSKETKFPQNLENFKNSFKNLMHELKANFQTNKDSKSSRPPSIALNDRHILDIDSMVSGSENPLQSLSIWSRSLDKILSDTMQDVLNIEDFSEAISHVQEKLVRLRSVLDSATSRKLKLLEELNLPPLQGQETSVESLFDESLNEIICSMADKQLESDIAEMKSSLNLLEKLINIHLCSLLIANTIKCEAISRPEVRDSLNQFLKLNAQVLRSMDRFLLDSYRNMLETFNNTEAFAESLKALNSNIKSEKKFEVLDKSIKNLTATCKLMNDNMALLKSCTTEEKIGEADDILQNSLSKTLIKFVNELTSMGSLLSGLMKKFRESQLNSDLGLIQTKVNSLLKNYCKGVSDSVLPKIGGLIPEILQLNKSSNVILSKTEKILNSTSDDSVVHNVHLKMGSLRNAINEFLQAASIMNIRSLSSTERTQDKSPSMSTTLEQFDNLIKKLRCENMTADEFASLLKLLSEISKHFKKIAASSDNKMGGITVSNWEEILQEIKELQKSRGTEEDNLKNFRSTGKESQLVTINVGTCHHPCVKVNEESSLKCHDHKDNHKIDPKCLGDYTSRLVDDNISMLCALCHKVMQQKTFHCDNIKPEMQMKPTVVPQWSYIAACQDCLDTCEMSDICSIQTSYSSSYCSDCLNHVRIAEMRSDKQGVDHNSNATISVDEFCSYCAFNLIEQEKYFHNNCSKPNSTEKWQTPTTNTCFVDLISLDENYHHK